MGNVDNWANAWPTEKGYWWFYGWTSAFGTRNDRPRLRLVEIKMGSNAPFYVTEGQFIYKNDAYGVWQEAELPETPVLAMRTS